MTMWRISPKEQLLFAAKPEVAMDTQIGIIGGKEVAIIGCRLAIAFDQKLENDLMHRREIMESIPSRCKQRNTNSTCSNGLTLSI